MNKNVVIASLIFIFSTNYTCAFDLDMTVDDEIRKNYNSSKLINDTHTQSEECLPSLPEISKYDKQNDTVNQVIEKEVTVKNSVQNSNIVNKTVKITKGTSFNVANSTKISDWLAKGNTVKFYTKSPIVKRKYTIPANTVFTGEILEVHRPQITCNGVSELISFKSKRIVFRVDIQSVRHCLTHRVAVRRTGLVRGRGQKDAVPDCHKRIADQRDARFVIEQLRNGLSTSDVTLVACAL